MTCVVGLVDGDRVWIGADSMLAAGCDHYPRVEQDRKVILRGEMLFGYAGPSRFGQLLEYLVVDILEQSADESDYAYLVRRFMPALKDAIDQYGGLKINDPSDGWDFLLGFHGNLYYGCHDLSVSQLPEYGATGCGHMAALGSLYTTAPTTYESIDPPYLNAETRIRLALNAAAEHDVHVCAPFVVESI